MADISERLTTDCLVLQKGDTFTVRVLPELLNNGWQGGTGVVWKEGGNDFFVGRSDGFYAGFLLVGSNEPVNFYTSVTKQQLAYGYSLHCFGSWFLYTKTFEFYTYASRTGGGPLVPIVYNAGDLLYFSLRGYWTKEDEWALSGDPRAPNTNNCGTVVQPVKLSKNKTPYLFIETSMLM